MINQQGSKSIGILWAQYGPYHCARFAALKRHASSANVHALEFSNQSSLYAWNRSDAPEGLITLCPGTTAEALPFLRVFRQARRTFADLKLDVCFLPSYAPKQSLAALLAAKSLGIRTVMMNESHAGTARTSGWKTTVKRRLVGLFDSAFVGGAPQKRYYESLGFAEERILIGYDAVDNNYFARRAEEIRGRESEVRDQYGLPEHYFLSLSRFVAKKNLRTLIHAFRKFLDANPTALAHLVMVGSGEEGPGLLALCRELNLPVHDKTKLVIGNWKWKTENEPPGVHFYGFRQIEENPVFFSLADAFIMPSLYEEWGLVVNEAMASGLPVIVSETAGCIEDLLAPAWLPSPSELAPDLSGLMERLAGRLRRNGIVFDPHSAEELSLALQLIETSSTLRRLMGAESRRQVEGCSCENFAQNAMHAAELAMFQRANGRNEASTLLNDPMNPDQHSTQNQNTVQKFFTENAEEYSELFVKKQSGSNFSFRERLNLASEMATELSGRLLDCACGSGEITAAVLKAGRFSEVTAVDLSPKMLDLARLRLKQELNGTTSLRLEFKSADIFEFAGQSKSEWYDLILCLGLVAHTGRLDELLAKLGSLLTPTGGILLQSTLLDHPGTRIARALSSERYYRQHGYRISYFRHQEIVQAAQRAGLKISIRRRFTFGLPFGDQVWASMNYVVERWMRNWAKSHGSEALYLLQRDEIHSS